jgi:heterodisulfide reductase subunit C/nitrate reductase gamma subunit
MQPTRETFGNIPPWSQWLFYLMAVVATAAFVYGLWRRFRLWQQGQPVNLREYLVGNVRQVFEKLMPGARRLLVEGLGQQRVRGRGLPSWAHGLMFAGFMMLFLGTTLLEIDHLAAMISEALKFHHGLYYIVYEFTLDVFGVLFLAGTILFFWRRLKKPQSVGHRLTDWYVLGSFLAIGLTGYLLEGLRIAWQHPEGIGAKCSPIGLWVSTWFSGLGDDGARAAHLGVWWLHAVLVFGFIASIPYTRLLHLITGPLNLFFARPGLGQLRPITLEEVEQTERMGVSDIRHFTQQQLLSLDACMECGRCEEVCPAFATGKPLSPKKVVQDLRQLMEETLQPRGGNGRRRFFGATPARNASRSDAGGGTDPAGRGTAPSISTPRALHGETIQAETLWACTACSACVNICPVRIDQLTLIIDMRRHLVAEGGLSGTAATALRRMQSAANPWGLPAAERTHWLAALNPQAPDPSDPENSSS